MDACLKPTRVARPALPALTSIRFVAAMWVVLYHYDRGGAREGFELFQNALLKNLISTGYCGVSLFFVLSGFILAYNYIDLGAPGREAPRYFVARFARIMPVYLLGMAIVAPFLLVMLHRNEIGALPLFGSLLSCLLLLQAWIPGSAVWNGPGWSLSAEAFFYSLFPFAIQRLRGQSNQRLFWGLLVLQALTMLPALAAVLWDVPNFSDAPAVQMPLTSNAQILLFLFCPLFRLPEFLFGCSAGVLFCRSSLTWDRRGIGSVIALAGFGMVAGLCLWGSEAIPLPVFHQGLLMFPFVTLMIGLAQPRSFIAKLLSAKWLEALGCASYAMYIIHVPVLSYLRSAENLFRVSAVRHTSIDLGIYLCVLIGLSLLVWRFIEEPARRWITHLASRLSAPTIPGSEPIADFKDLDKIIGRDLKSTADSAS